MILNIYTRVFQLYQRQRDDADETPLYNPYQTSKLCKKSQALCGKPLVCKLRLFLWVLEYPKSLKQHLCVK